MKLKQFLLLIALVIGTCLLSFSLWGQIPTSGLVAYWPMNGNFNDAGPSGLHGTNNGATATTNKAGAANNAMDFSNPGSTVQQFATHPIHSSLNFAPGQDFSYSFLLYLTSPWIHFGGIYENNLNYNGIGIWIWQSGGPTDYRIQFNYRNSSVGSAPIPVGEWKAITAVRSSGMLRIYIDGYLSNSIAEGTGTPSYGFTGKFGTMFYNAQSPPNYNGLNGKIDEFRIYNRALTATEIAQSAIVLLPLKLGDFTASKQYAGIRLDWETVSENNSSHFEIERSADGNHFNYIGRVNAAGNANDRRRYQYFDNQPLSGTAFYRLKLVDADGGITYGRVIALKNEARLSLSLFPNPATQALQLQIPSDLKQTALIRITNAAGFSLYDTNIELQQGANAASIPVGHFPAGVYFVSVQTAKGIKTKQFTRQ